ncbi:SLC33A1 [Mytilus coruscus]|uniref:SLC33A1 n=1 Tax=Mytilus coruscus TaxID=42192 RepID=A0A6J8CEV9_MYTCO|nr:SLC33A1 [Mytilus coruscus]
MTIENQQNMTTQRKRVPPHTVEEINAESSESFPHMMISTHIDQPGQHSADDKHDKHSKDGLKGDYGNISLLMFLYILQGIPLGLGTENGGGHVNIVYITVIFFMLNVLAATQDIAVDGWALTMLSRKVIVKQLNELIIINDGIRFSNRDTKRSQRREITL